MRRRAAAATPEAGDAVVAPREPVPTVAPPTNDVPEDCPGVFDLLVDTAARLAREVDDELRAECGVGVRTLEVLGRIDRSSRSRLTMTQLASATALTSGGITRLANRLESQGLLRRIADPHDRRVTHLELTTPGRALLGRATAVREHRLQRLLLTRLGPEDVERLHALLCALDPGPPDER